MTIKTYFAWFFSFISAFFLVSTVFLHNFFNPLLSLDFYNDDVARLAYSAMNNKVVAEFPYSEIEASKSIVDRSFKDSIDFNEFSSLFQSIVDEFLTNPILPPEQLIIDLDVEEISRLRSAFLEKLASSLSEELPSCRTQSQGNNFSCVPSGLDDEEVVSLLEANFLDADYLSLPEEVEYQFDVNLEAKDGLLVYFQSLNSQFWYYSLALTLLLLALVVLFDKRYKHLLSSFMIFFLCLSVFSYLFTQIPFSEFSSKLIEQLSLPIDIRLLFIDSFSDLFEAVNDNMKRFSLYSGVIFFIVLILKFINFDKVFNKK